MNPEHIKCPICQEIFDGNVYVLKCGHNLCSYCISRVYLEREGSYSDSEDDDNECMGSVKCPVCTAITNCNKKSNGTITGITRNITIESITQDYREKNGLLTSLDKERKENLLKKGQKMQTELEEKLKFSEMARKLLSNEEKIVNLNNSITAMLDNFKSTWENYSVKDLRKKMDDLDKALSSKMKDEIFNITFKTEKTRVAIYHGDILDAIEVDGQLFGGNGGNRHEINLAPDERVESFEYDLPTHSYWAGGMCKILINTNKTTYGPYGGVPNEQTKQHITIPSGTTFKEFLQANSAKTHRGKIKITV